MTREKLTTRKLSKSFCILY